MATLHEIAEAENADIRQLFVRASRLFAKGPAHPSADFDTWMNTNLQPAYLKEYVRYWEGLHRTETHRDRRVH